MCKDVPGGFGELMPAHDSMLFKIPDSITDEQAVFADPFAVSLHGITRHPPQPGSKVLVYGAGALGTSAVAILRRAVPGRRGDGRGALRRAAPAGREPRRGDGRARAARSS